MNKLKTESRLIEAVREVYAAINRNDIPAMRKHLDPQIERIEPEGFPMAGVYRGYAEVEAHIEKGRSTWAEGSCEPERLIVSDDRVVVSLHVRVRLKNHAEWIDARIADGFVFQNGKVIQMRSFVETKDAFAWAGIKEPSAQGEFHRLKEMNKPIKAVLMVASVIPLYLLINQLSFELDLNKLQNFCADLQLGLSFSQVETKVQEQASLRLSSPHLSENGAQYVNIALQAQPPDGWVCGLAFKQDVLFERVFGSDHGARRSFLKR